MVFSVKLDKRVYEPIVIIHIELLVNPIFIQIEIRSGSFSVVAGTKAQVRELGTPKIVILEQNPNNTFVKYCQFYMSDRAICFNRTFLFDADNTFKFLGTVLLLL